MAGATVQPAARSSGMILASGARGPGFNSRNRPSSSTLVPDPQGRRSADPPCGKTMCPSGSEILETLNPNSPSLSLSLSLLALEAYPDHPREKREARRGREKRDETRTEGREKVGWVGTYRLVDLRSWWGPLGGPG